MDIPPEWRKSSAESMLSAIEPSGGSATAKDGPVPGHKEHGRTLCVHSLSVLPDFQGQGLGRLLMTSYMQRMRSAGVADRIAIISHEALVPFYESLGFETQGQSPVQFGGGGWTDMVYHLNPDGP
ncbi:hypothetical protein ANO11243_062700 [Dothideomycetidae sp. 11243]|nr:hypothetical protein ANO11243_062700 [fungal sp. No.11243]